MTVTRRQFAASTLLAGAASSALLAAKATSAATKPPDTPTFAHGVASGDPLNDRIILWTRVTPAGTSTDSTTDPSTDPTTVISTDASAPVRVRWRIATDAQLRKIVNQGELLALPSRDFTVKVDALGLEPGRTYYYQFDANDHASPTGRTRTLPSGVVGRTRLAVVSCSNLPMGYFNAYAAIAARFDLDAVLHLGDYFYEYGPGERRDGEALGRLHTPDHELLTLADYRARHAQYKQDPDLQAAHRQHPWITVWDDHESANDAWTGGAQNHNPDKGDGDWATRKAAATRAYAEWMPIREMPDDDAGLRIYRRFAFGDLLDLIMLDTRLYGRAQQVSKENTIGAHDPTRSLLGNDQAQWLAQQLRRSQQRGAAFRLIGQQVMFSPLLDEHRAALNMDQWDGYAASRELILNQLKAEKISDVVVLSGDIHSAWAFDVPLDPFEGFNSATGKGSLAVEFVGPSVTSPGPFGTGLAAVAREAGMRMLLPHLKYVNFREHGYFVVDVTPERTQAEWYLFESVQKREVKEHLAAAFATARGANHLQTATHASPSNAERAPVVE